MRKEKDIDYNSKAIVTTDGENSYFHCDTASSAEQPVTVLFVGHFTTDGKPGLTSSDGGVNPALLKKNGRILIHAGVPLDSGVDADRPKAILVEYNGGDSHIGVNQWPDIKSPTIDKWSMSGDAGARRLGGKIGIGAYAGGNHKGRTVMAELVIVSGLLSDNEKAALKDYVNARYNFGVT